MRQKIPGADFCAPCHWGIETRLFVVGTVPLHRGARLVWGRHKCSPSFLIQSDLCDVCLCAPHHSEMEARPLENVTAVHYDTLQHTFTHCNIKEPLSLSKGCLFQGSSLCTLLCMHGSSSFKERHTAGVWVLKDCNKVQRTATNCNTLQHTAHTATHMEARPFENVTLLASEWLNRYWW